MNNQETILVPDITTLRLLQQLNLFEKVAQSFRLHVTPSTFDEINELFSEFKKRKKEGFKSIGSRDGKIYYQEIESHESERMTKDVEDLLQFIEIQCNIEAPEYALEVNREDRIEKEKVLGKSYWDSVLLAKRAGYLLFSEDYLLRQFAWQLQIVQVRLLFLVCR